MGIIVGRAYKDKCTKMLINRLCRDCIAVVKHKDMDLVAAQELKYREVKAVINCEEISESMPVTEGIDYLIKSNIKIYCVNDRFFFDMIKDGDMVVIDGNTACINNTYSAPCSPVSSRTIKKKISRDEKYSFISNTIEHMRDELRFFIDDVSLPELETNIAGRDVLIISRGRGYREDFMAVTGFVRDKGLLLIGVDGGANAVVEAGLKCDIIIGDMDSVSERSLKSCGEILVHSYSNGYAPGLLRIKQLGLKYKLVSLKGTSEDAAIIVAKQKGASTVYLIGSHMGIEEFLEKGRQGMGSTAILRMLFGSSIVDLKGISRLWEGKLREKQ